MSFKSWFMQLWKDYPMNMIVGIVLIISFIIFMVNVSFTYPNQACNECGYGMAIDVDGITGRVQCENRAIIKYDITRPVTDKWGYNKLEYGFWVSC